MKRVTDHQYQSKEEIFNNDWAVSYSDVISLLLVFFCNVDIYINCRS